MKYRPDYPQPFESRQQARQWIRHFLAWYNHEHHPVALGLMTPAVVHYGQGEQVRTQRQQVLDEAYACHPERVRNGPPLAPHRPQAVWINQPADTAFSDTADDQAQPGAQPGSRVGLAALEAGEHLATIEPLLWPVHQENSSLILTSDLFQSS